MVKVHLRVTSEERIVDMLLIACYILFSLTKYDTHDSKNRGPLKKPE
jgi:hypothetical protein